MSESPPASSLPADGGMDGFRLPFFVSDETFRSALEYKPRPEDIFLVAYPKSGSTWALHVIALILREGEAFDSKWFCVRDVPCIEFLGTKALKEVRGPRFLKSHLPYNLMPQSDQAKYILIVRNPKDACVSFYHHWKNLSVGAFEGTFDEYFELFINGNVHFGEYFHHLLSWYPHRNDSNVLFLTYEGMEKDLKSAILRIATFIDHEKYAALLSKDKSKLDFLATYCRLDNLDAILKTQVDGYMHEETPGIPYELKLLAAPKHGEDGYSHGACRKGGWRNYFSEDQSKRMDEKLAQTMEGTDLFNLWKEYM